jgi:hypothetical protein
VVDAPIDFASTQGGQVASAADQGAGRRLAVVEQPATQRQLNFIRSIAREIGLAESALESEVEQRFGANLGAISRRDASALIEDLQQRRPTSEMAS